MPDEIDDVETTDTGYDKEIDDLLTEPQKFYGEELKCPICGLEFRDDPDTFLDHVRHDEGISFSAMLHPENLKERKKSIAKKLADLGSLAAYKGNVSCVICNEMVKENDYYEHLNAKHLKVLAEMENEKEVEDDEPVEEKDLKEQDKFGEGLIDELKSILDVKAVCSVDKQKFDSIDSLLEHNKVVHKRNMYDVIDDVWKSIDEDGDKYEDILDYVENKTKKFNAGSGAYEFKCPECEAIFMKSYELADHILDKHEDIDVD